jgi:hypothetical protein
MLGIWLQAIGFQLVWFAWALGVPDDLLWPGAVVSVVFLLAHRLWQAHRRTDLHCVSVCLLFGILLDSVLMHWGWLSFAQLNPAPWEVLQPWWMGLLWACLGCTIHHSLAWLKGRLALSLSLSALAGVLSYAAAHRMGALELTQFGPACIALGLFWGLFIPLLQTLPRARKAASMGESTVNRA